jgi:hypothetical protein
MLVLLLLLLLLELYKPINYNSNRVATFHLPLIQSLLSFTSYQMKERSGVVRIIQKT